METTKRNRLHSRCLAVVILSTCNLCSAYAPIRVLSCPQTRLRRSWSAIAMPLEPRSTHTPSRRRRPSRIPGQFVDSLILHALELDSNEKVCNENRWDDVYFADRLIDTTPSDDEGDLILSSTTPEKINGFKSNRTTNMDEDDKNTMVVAPTKVPAANGFHQPTVAMEPKQIPELEVQEIPEENQTPQFSVRRLLAPLEDRFRAIKSKLPLDATNFELENDIGYRINEEETSYIRRLWKRRHARTLEEGIRRERATELSDLLTSAQIDARKPQGRLYVERTIMGLINALTEEIDDLDVEYNGVPKTPFWRKEVEEIKINFSRLGFKPIRMGGSDKYDEVNAALVEGLANADLSSVESADEAFSRIDKDKSGTLDREEIAEALNMISVLETDKQSIDELASELVELYDVNSDGVVDRDEYQQMVEDMAKLRPTTIEELPDQKGDPLKAMKKSVQTFSKGISEKAAQVASSVTKNAQEVEVVPDEKEMGSIVLSDLNLDLRRLLFGGIPIIKRITPGGPLILEPFSVTLKVSFSREDVMGSFLLDSGLRLLVARALRVRIRSFRDIVDGAYFFGRQWKMASKTAPVVQVLGLANVEFDSQDKMIITGRARVRTGPDAPVVTNTFKVRTKIGTEKNGQSIRLVEPELAFVFECPEALDNGLRVVCKQLGVPPPTRPEPVYSFFPIYSPLKVNYENAGFDMGEDNRIRRIFIKDGKLRIEMRAVLRPGRFLGNHYIAFTVPNRTFIITMDRVREGIRAARKNKQIAAREKKLATQSVDDGNRVGRAVKSLKNIAGSSNALRRRLVPSQLKKQKKRKSFFSRFVEGYTLFEREVEANNERLTSEISNWFGRQGTSFSSNMTFPED